MVKRFGIPKGMLRECKQKGCKEREFYGGECKPHYEESLVELNRVGLFKQ